MSKPASGVLPPEGSNPTADPSEAGKVAVQSISHGTGGLATKLGAARAAVEARVAAGQSGRLDPVEHARRQPTSRRLAITAKCWTCMRGDLDPDARGRIRECPSTACPLYPVRPFQRREAST